ncbi:Aste57867_1294 [Aphanomyces stellatus]|uniref:Aste57867_1294 protein n=1 Tax=Aphanomyces stellatus TaxID=120398 RepID=A0A485K925_9STRA|nr:hypothetical protein As57867_001293 [Aphanomyces stellatus]VFT78513.1 Aste57867_1294 [Aphanomyces stellatus]
MAAAAVTPVTSRIYCTFSDCGHCDQGFRDTYLRYELPTQWAQGSSVSTPSPWLAPSSHCARLVHLDSCGTNVVMQVAGQFTPDEATTFVAFARFETSVEPTFSLGHCVAEDEIHTANTPKIPQWYPGRSSGGAPSDDGGGGEESADMDLLLRFTFNEHMQKPWCYSWTSSASAALRNTMHVFKAYLFATAGNNTLQVVGMAQSQGFSIVPYKSAMMDERRESAAAAVVPPHALSGFVEPIPSAIVVRGFKCHFVPCPCDKPMFGPNYIRYVIVTSHIHISLVVSSGCEAAIGQTDEKYQLRCFPHCCPQHNLHCSCGGPIMIGVDVSPDMSMEAQLVMYAHAERVHMPELQLEDEVPLDQILSNLHQPGQNDRGDWVEGVLQPTLSDTSRLMFNFNENSRHIGWPYNWKGSATKADRNQQHVFKAYVFLRLSGRETDMLRVVNWISSTPFTMSSFRRCNTTPTSRTNKYIQVKPTEISDRPQKVPPLQASRKRPHDRLETSPLALLDEMNSAG